MRAVAFISDLHANLVALDAVLADIDQAGIREIVCLGDIVDLGPEPVATIQRLRHREIPCVQGNHDLLDEKPPMPLLASIEAWTRDQLDADAHQYLKALPSEITLAVEGLQVRCVHGTPDSFHNSILHSTPDADLDRWADEHPHDVLLAGHTHVPLTRYRGRRLIVNVGSVGSPFVEPFSGQPPQVLPCIDYAILRVNGRTASIEHRRLPLDVEAYRRSVRASSLPNAEEWLRQWE